MGTYDNHTVVTEDGFQLLIFRIPHKDPSGIAILLHPVTIDAVVWVGQDNTSLGTFIVSLSSSRLFYFLQDIYSGREDTMFGCQISGERISRVNIQTTPPKIRNFGIIRKQRTISINNSKCTDPF